MLDYQGSLDSHNVISWALEPREDPGVRAIIWLIHTPYRCCSFRINEWTEPHDEVTFYCYIKQKRKARPEARKWQL